ncbi:atp18 subunit J of the mitochondrial F1F0 ATP synthase [Coemansia sp. RSA 1646]|nr:atp18 subunit J of the mitochondrial F1F0 ATP synthase [Coemansia sp. RSA 1646]
MRAWPFPYAKLMHPFLIGGGLTFLMFSKIQDVMCDTEGYANNPSNPKYAEIQARKHKAEGH